MKTMIFILCCSLLLTLAACAPGMSGQSDLAQMSWQDCMRTLIVQRNHGDEYDPKENMEAEVEECGSYGDKHVAYVDCVDCVYFQAEWTESLGGYEFRHIQMEKLMVYRDGEAMILTLQEAYDAGWFTDAEMQQLHEDFKKLRPSEKNYENS